MSISCTFLATVYKHWCDLDHSNRGSGITPSNSYFCSPWALHCWTPGPVCSLLSNLFIFTITFTSSRTITIYHIHDSLIRQAHIVFQIVDLAKNKALKTINHTGINIWLEFIDDKPLNLENRWKVTQSQIANFSFHLKKCLVKHFHSSSPVRAHLAMTAVLTPHPECPPGPEPVELLQGALVKVLLHPACLVIHIHVHQGKGGIEMLHSNKYILEPSSQGL